MGEIEDLPVLSEDTLKLLERRVGGALMNVVNGRFGVNVLAASSMLAQGDAYIKPTGMEGTNAVLLEYANGMCIFVSFYASEETVIANATFGPEGSSQMLLSQLKAIGVEFMK